MAARTTKHWQLRTEVLRLGPNVPESVDAARQEFHEWIAKRFVSPVRAEGNALATKYLPADQIRSHPNLLPHLITTEPLTDERTITIIDASLNHYQIMSENVLQSLAICALDLTKTEDRICVIMLASFPHNDHSPFWTALADMETDGGSVVVVNNEGEPRQYGRSRKPRRPLGDEYKRRQRKISGTLLQEFEDKIIRRMGHFNINNEYCSRFFFDGTRAVSALSELLVGEIRKASRGKMARTELLAPADCAAWMKSAVSAAANLLDMRLVFFPDATKAEESPRKSITYLAVLDFVSTGNTYRKLVDDAQEAGYSLHEYAIAAFVARDFHHANGSRPSVQAIKRVTVERATPEECKQCQLRMPHTSRTQDDLIGLRSYDAWEMLLSVDWEPEKYGPPGVRIRSLPSFPQLVNKYGDYLAYKLENVLNEVAPKDVAIVCPEEPAVRDLAKRIQPWVDGRIVAVLLPRNILSTTEGATRSDIRSAGNETEWGRQLSHLSDRKASVVMIDEFNASNTTAKQMLKVLSAYQVDLRAYVPIFNFALSDELGNVRVEALYEFPNPREAWS
jgi:hypothetical protein